MEIRNYENIKEDAIKKLTEAKNVTAVVLEIAQDNGEYSDVSGTIWGDGLSIGYALTSSFQRLYMNTNVSEEFIDGIIETAKGLAKENCRKKEGR